MISLQSIKQKLLSWIHHSPEEALLTLGMSCIVMLIAMSMCFILIFRTPSSSGELPSNTPDNTKISNGWKFLSRDKAGTDVCDLYQKGMSYKVKCYGKDENGKWFLREVF